MRECKRLRALILVGAGASVEYGFPGTIGFGELIDEAVRHDGFCRETGGTDVYFDIKGRRLSYYQSSGEAHFERLYHVLHELSALRLTPGAAPEFRPVMYPFVRAEKQYSDEALRAAAQTMLKAIYLSTSEVCESPKISLNPLTTFLSTLESNFLPRIYTTNYDDFIEQAAGTDHYFTGFTKKIDSCALFDPADCWSNWGESGCFHVHGAVRMGFPHPTSNKVDIGDIAWFESRKDALKCVDFNGSRIPRMDGTGLIRSAIITGLDKLGRLQQSPFASYYAGIAREVMEADVIFVFGSGLADLHLNTCLKAARRYRSQVPLLYVGYWPGDTTDLYANIQFENNRFGISLFHELGVDLVNVGEPALKAVDGWTIDAHRTAAVWADGFQSFLNQSAGFANVLKELGVTLEP